MQTFYRKYDNYKYDNHNSDNVGLYIDTVSLISKKTQGFFLFVSEIICIFPLYMGNKLPRQSNNIRLSTRISHMSIYTRPSFDFRVYNNTFLFEL